MLPDEEKDLFYDDAEKFWPKEPITLEPEPHWVFHPNYASEYFESHMTEIDPDIRFVSLLDKEWTVERQTKIMPELTPKAILDLPQINNVYDLTLTYTRIPDNAIIPIMVKLTENEYIADIFAEISRPDEDEMADIEEEIAHDFKCFNDIEIPNL